FEDVHNDGFDPGADDGVLLQRVLLHADLHATARVRLFAQVISAESFGEKGTAPPVNDDDPDLQQGFVDVIAGTPTTQGPRVTTRVGRFSMTYGSGRLVATRAGPNVPLKFDGFEWIGASGDRRLYAFLVRPVEEDTHAFDHADEQRTFWGAYAVLDGIDVY